MGIISNYVPAADFAGFPSNFVPAANPREFALQLRKLGQQSKPLEGTHITVIT